MVDSPTQAEAISLMQRAKAGDKQAFEKLYHYYFLPVFRYTLRRVQSKKDAEDVTQSVFLKVYVSHTPFQNQSISPLAYFFTVARSVIADHWRKNGRVAVVEEEINNEEDMRTVHQKVEQQLSMEQAMHQLPEEQQQVLKLKFFEGQETREIAAKLQKTEMAIRQIQCRALKKLREFLGDKILMSS